jgi:hypothetical protein
MKMLFIFLFILPLSVFNQNNYITNKEYNEFVTYVRDSLLRYTMGEEVDEEAYLIAEYKYQPKFKRTFIRINWKTKLNVNSSEAREALEPWYYEPSERLNRKREFDTRKFIHNGVKVYPDIMIWCKDSSINKSWAIFLSKYYYTHTYFENYPVYGLDEQQVRQYLKWKYPNKEKVFDFSNNENINLTLPKEKLQFSVSDYFEFYQYIRDSIVIRILAEDIDEEKYFKYGYDYFEEGSLPILNMKAKIKWKDELIIKTFKNHKLLNANNQINNMRLMYDYSWLDYYKAIFLPDSTERGLYFGRMMVNVGVNGFIEEYSGINIKKQLKNKTEVNYSLFDSSHIRAFYYWKKSNYPKKDVFDGFIPYSNGLFWEENSELFIKDNDIELLRTGKLPYSFYQFKITIPTIHVK